MVVTVVSELVVGRWKLLKTLSCNGREVSSELRVLSQHHRPTSHEAIYKRFLTHYCSVTESTRNSEKPQHTECVRASAASSALHLPLATSRTPFVYSLFCFFFFLLCHQERICLFPSLIKESQV